jgi:hypothetical protein
VLGALHARSTWGGGVTGGHVGGRVGCSLLFSTNFILDLSFLSRKSCGMEWGITVRFCGATVMMGL